MRISVEGARERIRSIVDVIVKAREDLLEVRWGLPQSGRETSRRDLDRDPSPSTEMRTVIDCVLRDALDPAVRDLLGAAGYEPKKTRRRKP